MKQFYCNSKKGICKNMNCTNCKKYNGTGGNYIEADENRKPTNFDKITESVENLAEFFDKYFDCKCSGGFTECNPNLYCIDCFKEWLQKECE